jgi:hypothetical protein
MAYTLKFLSLVFLLITTKWLGEYLPWHWDLVIFMAGFLIIDYLLESTIKNRKI